MPIQQKFLRFLAVFSICATGALIAGCEAEVSTGGDQIDEASAELTIKRQYADHFPGLKLSEISCESTEAKVDNTFTCTGSNDNGVDLDFKGTITGTDKEKDTIDFTWTITKAVTDGSAYEKPALDALQGVGDKVTAIDCPEFEVTEGEKVECEATMQDGSSQTAVIKLTDGNGGFQVKLSDTPVVSS